MPSFEELGLRTELLRALEDEEIETPTALQAGIIPALRRGTNVVARASTGSGKTLAYLLGVFDRLRVEPETDGAEPRLRVLVLTATAEEAERIGVAAFPLAQAVGLTVAVGGGAWGTRVADADVLIASPSAAMREVRSSALKLDAVESVVVDGAAAIHELGEWEPLDTLLDLVPRDAQRVLISARFPDEVEDLADRRVKRALRYPAESALRDEREVAAEGVVHYVLASGAGKLDVLLRQLSQPREGEIPPVVFCRTDERAAEIAEQLAIRGFAVGSVDDSEADLAVVAADATREELLEEAEGDLGQTLSYDVPGDTETLLARHGGDADAVVLVEPRELPHLHEIARLARLDARAIPLPGEQGAPAERLRQFRAEIARALEEEDLASQLLVLQPLLEQHPAAEVAAALSALLRRRPPARPVAAPPAAAPSVAAPRESADAGPPPATWSRLYVGVGSRDEIRPGDLVGALAGEANIPGSRIGKIEIRDSFSIVEVQSDVAEKVIRAVNGTSIKGRSVRVDYDRGGAARKGAGPARRQGGRAEPGRRVVRRPPRESRD